MSMRAQLPQQRRPPSPPPAPAPANGNLQAGLNYAHARHAPTGWQALGQNTQTGQTVYWRPAPPPGLIAVWDANHLGIGGRDWELWDDACRWALAHDGDNDTHRYEIWFLDGPPSAHIHRYAAGRDGCRWIDPGTGHAAMQPPLIVPLGGLPPQGLRVNADSECLFRPCGREHNGGGRTTVSFPDT